MRHYIYIITLIFAPLLTKAQFSDKYASQWDMEVLAKANTAKDVEYLSTQEKLIIYYTNLARMNPALFADTYLKEFAERNNEKFNITYHGLVREMRKLDPLEPLQPSEALWEVAKSHAKVMGENGKTGHRNPDGEFYRDRTAHLRENYKEVRENIHYGFNEAIDIVGDLLLDDGFKDRVHRRTIFNPSMQYIGPAINAHTKFAYHSVIDYATAPYEMTGQ